MQFSTAQSEVAAQLGLDETDSETLTLLKRWLNLSYQDIVGWKNWTWLQAREAIAMAIDDTETTLSVTASVAASGTTVTFSGTIATSQADRYIQFDGADDWYKITAHTAGTNTATIDPGYVQSTALSAGDFTIRTFFYEMSSSVEKIFDCRRAESKGYVEIIPANLSDKYTPFTESTGKATSILLWGQELTDGQWTFTPRPWPDEAYLLEFRVYKKATELSGDTDSPIFPSRFDSVWLDRAKAYGWEHNDDSRAAAAFSRTDRGLNRLKSQDTIGLTEKLTIEPIDVARGYVPMVRFPDKFQQ